VAQVRNYFRQRGEQCREQNAPVEEWELAPLANFKHNNKAKLRAEAAEWLDKPVQGHTLVWNGKRDGTGNRKLTHFDPDPALVTCTRCTKSWPFAHKTLIHKYKPCTGSPDEMEEFRKRSEQKLRQWIKEHPTCAHDLAFHRATDRWYCRNCLHCGKAVFNIDPHFKGYSKAFEKFAVTACQRHAEREAIT
jgi:hypothetical protein